MRRTAITLLALLAPASWAAAPTTLDELIDSLKDSSALQAKRLQEREARFVAARNERERLLEDARDRRREAEREADRLRADVEGSEQELADLENRLDENAGDLRELFTVVRQITGDVAPMVESSLVSAEQGPRNALLRRLAEPGAIPAAKELRELWMILLAEMHHSGRVSRFEAPVISADGAERTRRVTRIGTFTALADGSYLRYLPETGRLLALGRQPAGVDVGDVLAFEEAREPLQRVAIDPSRGSILSLIVQTPDVRERIEQGGVIGYIILALGALGLLLGVERLVTIGVARQRTRRVLADSAAAGDHVIVELRELARDEAYLADAEALSAKMDEVVTIASEKLRRGLPTLAIFAAVSPLLGLLGTVTGMIETFQVITLFGAGDPRLMSGGISQALITTQLGLAVAIPLLLIQSFVQGRANALIATLDETAAELFAQGRTHRGSDHAG
jgi:biopolymer transport protein ExbB